MNLSEALTVSSDVYFFQLGDNMWLNRGRLGDDALAKADKLWGFGADSGLDLGGESNGRVPDPAWKRGVRAGSSTRATSRRIQENERWFSGDNLNTAVGQGDVLVTPLQLANGYATFANGGTLYQPQLVLQVAKSTATPCSGHQAPSRCARSSAARLAVDRSSQGLEGVTTSGTAASAFAGFPQDRFQVAGKTGTAAGERQGQHLAVRGVRAGERTDGTSPRRSSTEAGYGRRRLPPRSSAASSSRCCGRRSSRLRPVTASPGGGTTR